MFFPMYALQGKEEDLRENYNVCKLAAQIYLSCQLSLFDATAATVGHVVDTRANAQDRKECGALVGMTVSLANKRDGGDRKGRRHRMTSLPCVEEERER